MPCAVRPGQFGRLGRPAGVGNTFNPARDSCRLTPERLEQFRRRPFALGPGESSAAVADAFEIAPQIVRLAACELPRCRHETASPLVRAEPWVAGGCRLSRSRWSIICNSSVARGVGSGVVLKNTPIS